MLGRLLDIVYYQDKKLDELHKFYPYQKTIKATVENYEQDKQKSIMNSLKITAGLWVGIFYAARGGYVARNFFN